MVAALGELCAPQVGERRLFMLATERLGAAALDIPTLFFVAVCLAALLGLFLIFAWLQERHTRALAWWGAAYLLGASSMALWNAPQPLLSVPPDVAGAIMFIACGMIWNGVRLFHGRNPLLAGSFAGAAAWLTCMRFPAIATNDGARAMVGAIIIAAYTLSIALELWRERRKTLFSRTAAIVVPLMHCAIFLTPIAMEMIWPDNLGRGWLELLGAGLVHPNVLRNGGYDPSKFRGIAFGMGMERAILLKHQINDIRYFYQDDLRFLQQFK